MWYSINNIPTEIPAPDRVLLVAYANLLEDYGWPLSVLDAYDLMSAGGAEPLNWQSGDRIEGLRLSQDSEQSGWPLCEPAIVVFEVDGDRFPCYVADIENHTIIDSYDGILKPGSVYGRPVAWASFAEPRPPATPEKKELVPYTHNTVDGIAYESLGKPKRMYVCRTDGTDLVDFSGYISTFRDFAGIPATHLAFGDEVRVIGLAKHPVLPTGQDFLMTLDDWGNFGRTGVPARLQGFVRDHLSEQKPVELEYNAPPASHFGEPVAIDSDKQVFTMSKDRAWQALTKDEMGFKYLRDDHQPVRYRVMHDLLVQDLGSEELRTIKVDKGITIAIYGTFWHDGTPYMLPRLDNPTTGVFDYWFGVPEFADDESRNIKVIPDLLGKTTEPTWNPAPIPALQPAGRRQGLDDIIVNVSTVLEVIMVRGIVKIKSHIERIKRWK